MRKTIIFLIILFNITLAQSNEKLKIGIALRGGGALGFAHIGTLSVIDSLEIPIDFVAGTSMGGLIGGLYAIGYSPEEMTAFVMNVDWTDIFNDAPSRKHLPYLIKKNSGKFQLEMDVTSFTPSLPSGLVAGQKIYKTFFNMTYPYEGIKSFDDLPIPFRCVGADLVTGKEIIFQNGPLAKAMRATMSIPTIFDPVRYDSAMVVDGGMTNNFPVDVTKNMGADFVIGLNLVSPQKGAEYYDNLLKIINRTLDIPRETKLNQTIDMADLLIQQNIAGFTLSDFDTIAIRKIIHQGKKAAYEVLGDLLELKKRVGNEYFSQSDPDARMISKILITGNSGFTKANLEKILHIKEGRLISEAHLLKRLERFNRSTNMVEIKISTRKVDTDQYHLIIHIEQIYTPVLHDIVITGNDRISDEFILNFLGLQGGTQVNFINLEQSLALLYGLKYFESIRYLIDQNPDQSVSLTLEMVEKSAQKFSFGFHYDDYFKLVGALGLRTSSFLIPGLFIDSELQFSGITRLRTDIFYPSRSMDFPVYPIFSFGYQDIHRDVYNTEGQNFLRYDEMGWYLGGGLGISPINFFNFETKILSQYPVIKLDVGEVGSGSGKFKDYLLTLNADIDIDLLDNVLIPKQGLLLKAVVEYSNKNLGSEYNYTRFESLFDCYYTFALRHTIRLNGRYLRSWKEEPFYKTVFYVGGPETFFGMHYSQGIGTRFAIWRIDYLLEYYSDLYLRAVVNSSPFYSIGLPSNTVEGEPLWGFGFGLLYDSILGPVEISFSWGEKTPFDPGTYIPLLYFTAGYKL